MKLSEEYSQLRTSMPSDKERYVTGLHELKSLKERILIMEGDYIMKGIKTRNRLSKAENTLDYLEELRQGEQRLQATNTWALRTFLQVKHTQSELVRLMSGVLGMALE